MTKSGILRYDDFQWRIEQIATEQRVWPDSAAISLPVLVFGTATDEERNRVGIAAFIYGILPARDSSNPEILLPHALVRIWPDGELIASEVVPRQAYGQGPVGHRFDGDAADMTDEERSAFIETYYELLTDAEGPLNAPWPSIDPEIRGDLRELFRAMVEAKFIPLYNRYAGEFMDFIGVASRT